MFPAMDDYVAWNTTAGLPQPRYNGVIMSVVTATCLLQIMPSPCDYRFSVLGSYMGLYDDRPPDVRHCSSAQLMNIHVRHGGGTYICYHMLLLAYASKVTLSHCLAHFVH
jgi:hypothetical protein